MLEAASRKAAGARERILEAAQSAVIAKGFAATSIDELIAAAGITRSGFFYHFRDKNELAKALLERYIAYEQQLFDDLFGRADELNEDPLHGFLVGLRMLAELLADMPGQHPGCIVAAYCYQAQQFNREVRDLNAEALLNWRRRFKARLESIAETYPPRVAVDLEDLADMLSAVADGGIILSRVTGDKTLLPRQILLYRDFVRSIFLGTPPRRDDQG